MTTQQPQLYPGMLNTDTEFFKTTEGLKVISSGIVSQFKDISMPLYQRLKEKMQAEPKVFNLLKVWHPQSELAQLEKFTECRFGGLDFTPDISDSKVQDGEYWDCPFRGNCKGEGIVCKPLKFNNHILETLEIKLLNLLATNYTNEVIAEMLTISYGQFHKIKKILYAKLGIQTKQEATLIAVNLNLIKRTYAHA